MCGFVPLPWKLNWEAGEAWEILRSQSCGYCSQIALAWQSYLRPRISGVSYVDQLCSTPTPDPPPVPPHRQLTALSSPGCNFFLRFYHELLLHTSKWLIQSFLLTVKSFGNSLYERHFAKSSPKYCMKLEKRYPFYIYVCTCLAFYFSITSLGPGKHLSSWNGSLPHFGVSSVSGELFLPLGVFLRHQDCKIPV